MVNIETDLVFDPEKNLTFDLYKPEQPNNKILIFWHGGGWFKGDKSTLHEIGNKAADEGFLTFIPNYRLAPRYTFPSAHDDVHNFVQWLLQSAYIKDDSEITQIGASVGGTMALAISMAYQFKTVTWSAPINFSAWMDEHRETISSNDAKNELSETDFQKIKDSFYKYFVSTYIGDPLSKEKLTQLDVLSNYQGQIGDLLLFNSTNELVPLKDTLDLIQVLSKDNNQLTLQTITGEGHAMDYGMKALVRSLDFLNA